MVFFKDPNTTIIALKYIIFQNRTTLRLSLLGSSIKHFFFVNSRDIKILPTMSDKAILEINGQKYEFPTFIGSENEIAIISVR